MSNVIVELYTFLWRNISKHVYREMKKGGGKRVMYRVKYAVNSMPVSESLM